MTELIARTAIYAGMHKAVLLAAAAAAAISLDARAEAFIGAAAGVSDWPGGVCSAAESCDHRDGTWLVRGGYMFAPYIGIEARYVDLGRARASLPFVANGTPMSLDTRYESKGAAIGAVAALPVSPAFAVVAVLGAARLESSLDTPDTTVPGSAGTGVVTQVGFRAEETKTNPYYGLGVDYRVYPNVTIGVDATRYRVQLGGTDNVDTFTASLTFHFR